MNPELSSYAASALAGPLLLAAAAFAGLILPLFLRPLRGAQGLLALGAAVTGLVFFRRPPSAELALFGGALTLTPLTAYIWAFALAATAAVCVISISAQAEPEEFRGEYYFLLLMSACGLMALAAAGDLFTAFIALELMSLPVYALAGITRGKAGLEAALKYFMLGSFGSALLIMGIALLNAVCPSLSFAALKGAQGTAAAAGFMLATAGFAFKTALVPFHMWVPDVYEGAPAQVSAFMAAAVKAGGALLLCRLFCLLDAGPAREAFWWLAAVTMVTANLAALAQDGLKRLLAYSSVAQAGYLATAFFGGEQGRAALLYYVPVYAAATVGAFAVSAAAGGGEKGPAVKDLAGLARRRPWLAAAMAVFMLSLAGIPPAAGFFAKFYAFAAAAAGGRGGLVVLAAVMSAVSLFYYLRVTVVMFMAAPEAEQAPEAGGAGEVLAVLLAAGLLAAGLFSGALLGPAAAAARWF